MNALARLLIGVMCGVSVAAMAATDAPRDAMQHFFHQSFNSLPDEVATAKAEGQQAIFVMFVLEDCPWCAKMKANVLSQPVVQEYYRKHFRVLIMDANGDAPMTDFGGKEIPQKDFAFRQNRVRATPVFVFYDLDGKVITRYTGATRDVEEFLWLGEYVVSGKWKTANFTSYRRERAGGKP